MTTDDPGKDDIYDDSYNSMTLDALSWAQTSAKAVGLFTALVQVSVDAWVRFSGLPAETIVLGQNDVFSFGSRAGSVYFQFAGLPVVLSDSTQSQLHDEQWHYICATFDGSTIRLYIDGYFNTGQSCTGQVAVSTNPVLIGKGVQGLVKRVRIYNVVLDSKAVLNNMFNTPATDTVVADFDFSVNPPIDRGPSSYPLSLQNNASMVRISPAVSLGNNGFVRPLGDTSINPGGEQVDPYSVQAWIYISSDVNPVQAVFVNSDLMLDTGMALYVRYDSTKSAFYLVSQRGSDSDTGQSLTSSATIPKNVWTNVATTFDGTILSLYINGKPDGSMNCKPIPLYNPVGDLLIGATIEEGEPLGTATLQGYISEVDVWSRTLSADEIADFMATPPDVLSTGLKGAYVFTNSPARNQVNGHPVALAEGAVIFGQVGSAPVSADRNYDDCVKTPDMGLDPDVMAKIRAELDFREYYENNRDAFDEAEARDVAAFDDSSDKEMIRKAWADVRDKLVNDPTSLPFLVTHHKIDGEHLLIVHRPAGSYVAYRTAEGNFDDCTMWKINLVFIVIAGALDALTGVGAKLTNKGIKYISKILDKPGINTLLSKGGKISASIIFSILALLCTKGMLKQLILLVIDVGFWTLIRVVANVLLMVAGVGSARVIASLVATAATFALTYTNRPKSCDPLPSVTLASIAFDYNLSGTTGDALTIRKNYGSNISLPEWVPGKALPEDAPCAYALDLIAGNTPTIEVVLNIPTPTTPTIVIRATGGGILGAIDPTSVTFGSATSVTQILSLSNQTLAAGGVQRADVTWNWQYQEDGGTWKDMATTQHRVYVILEKPCNPWKQTSNRTNQQLPWTEVLDYACTWAAGANNIDDILSKVTTKVNSGIGLVYDTSGGKSVYTGNNGGLNRFLCTRFIHFLNTGKGNGKTVNCTDCATIVTTFANILGADVMEAIMNPWPGTGGFSCNQILAIGTTKWKTPFNNGRFSYHEVAWTDAGFLTDFIYDACLQYDTGSNPWGTGSHTAGLPVNVEFSKLPQIPPLPVSINDARYRERLATNTNTGIPKCLPQGSKPNTNSGRRPVR